MHGLEDRCVSAFQLSAKDKQIVGRHTDISGGGETESADQSCGEVGQDVAVPARQSAICLAGAEGVQIGHDHHTVGEWSGVGSDVEADSIEEVFGVADFRVLFGDSSAGGEEHPIAHLPAQPKEDQYAADDFGDPELGLCAHMMFALCTAVT